MPNLTLQLYEQGKHLCDLVVDGRKLPGVTTRAVQWLRGLCPWGYGPADERELARAVERFLRQQDALTWPLQLCRRPMGVRRVEPIPDPVQELQRRLARLRQERDEALRQREEVQGKLRAAEERLSALQQQLQAQGQKAVEVAAENRQLREQLEEHRRVLCEVQARWEKAIEECERLRAQLQQAQTRLRRERSAERSKGQEEDKDIWA